MLHYPTHDLTTAPPAAASGERARKVRCCAKERERNHAMNSSFQQLQTIIPYLPATRRVPRIKLLRLASAYISHLTSLLENTDDDGEGSISAAAMEQPSLEQFVREEVVRQNSYKDRAEREIATKRKISSVPDDEISPIYRSPKCSRQEFHEQTGNGSPLYPFCNGFVPLPPAPFPGGAHQPTTSLPIGAFANPLSVSIPPPPQGIAAPRNFTLAAPPKVEPAGPGLLACAPYSTTGGMILPDSYGTALTFTLQQEGGMGSAPSNNGFGGWSDESKRFAFHDNDDSGYYDSVAASRIEDELSSDAIDVVEL